MTRHRRAVAASRPLALILGVALLAAGGPAGAQPRAAGEYEIKAAFLFNFAKFAEWPAGAVGEAFVVGVLGDDPFGPVLDEAVRGKAIEGRPIVVRRFSSVEQAAGGQIVFVSRSEEARLPQVLRRLGRAPVLTVGETDRFAERGGIVGLRVDGDRVRFDINVDAAQRAGLTLSSQLLRLARIVRTEPGTGP